MLGGKDNISDESKKVIEASMHSKVELNDVLRTVYDKEVSKNINKIIIIIHKTDFYQNPLQLNYQIMQQHKQCNQAAYCRERQRIQYYCDYGA